MMAASDTTSHVLPGLSIDGAKASDSLITTGGPAQRLWQATWPLVRMIEVTEHPLQLLSSAAVGVAMGAGLALASPEIAYRNRRGWGRCGRL